MDDSNREQKADAILQRVEQENSGRLTVFLGAAPGVGKTYSMLAAAKEKQQSGRETIIGLVETHGRSDTQQMADGFEQLPLTQIEYHGTQLSEFAVDAALQRKPDLILVDELAHTNVPGSRNKRRYQDIEELLNAGIDVYTTVNIQHMASVNDLVLQMTGVRVNETVPDHFVDSAYEIRFIDLPPATLIERLQQGKVYLPEYARSALSSFFSSANLTALRELAMKKALERVDATMLSELAVNQKSGLGIYMDKLLVLVSANSDHRYLIRVGRQIAERRQIPWAVAWVDTGKTRSPEKSQTIELNLALAKELGAQTKVLKGTSTISAVSEFIKDNAVCTVLVGAGRRNRFNWWRKRLYHHLINLGLPIEVTVFRARSTPVQKKKKLTPPAVQNFFGKLSGYVHGAIGVGIASLLAVILENFLNVGNLVLVYTLAVIFVGLTSGSRPAMFTAILSFLSFNFLLTEPKNTLMVYNHDDVTTLIFLTVIGLICGPAASRIRSQFLLLKQANHYAETLRDLAQELATVSDETGLWKRLSKLLRKSTEVDCLIAVPDEDSDFRFVESPPAPPHKLTEAAIRWSFKNKASAGVTTETLSAAKATTYPVIVDDTVVAVAAVPLTEQSNDINSASTSLILAMLNQASNAWRRIHLASDLESARVKTEVEQLRSALLSSVSHDLKSPLSAMMGAAESLKLLHDQLPDKDRIELIDTIISESQRLDSYIQNLLDMTRLGHGTLKIERDWVSVDDIIGSAIRRLKRYWPSTNVQIERMGEPPLLYVHAALVEQAIFNILENAAKYSPDESPIFVELHKGRAQCLIAIEDRGPGIPSDQRDKIFDMFYIVADGDKKKQNTGMGLAICKGMIGAHGGNVVATSARDGVGTRFEITLPLDYGNNQQEES
ncbi:two-component system sensor histidine kinase KdpD [Idiomarina loihiensis]|jgi:two-component system sensor histidine kinase KdpD|uniref:sensor histidine kinase n=1 Tax=Idiomarina TaxID=135575 RepID=UPI000D718B74|nr:MULTISPECIES: sensor histidine kinase KdpD [Idiomarina]PWW40366.1 two-component system sensor histidine kinase KdpD [Idiomarina loihiensis]TDP50057.1 two-component system sensor histidine kinase KdpD [Idiomarina loihiensis]TDS24591.1 two-component system sensor histidine kinase KdpD [Idiomarina sp. H2]